MDAVSAVHTAPQEEEDGRSRINIVFAEAIEYGFGIPGELVRAALYESLETNFHIKREEITEKLEMLHDALQTLLASSTPVLERQIARHLYRRLRLDFPAHQGWTLVDYVNHARKTCLVD